MVRLQSITLTCSRFAQNVPSSPGMSVNLKQLDTTTYEANVCGQSFIVWLFEGELLMEMHIRGCKVDESEMLGLDTFKNQLE